MKNGKRDYKREDKWDAKHKDPHGLSRADAREARHTARSEAIRTGMIHKGSKLQIDHKVPLAKGGSKTGMGNLRAVSGAENMSFRRNAKGGLVSQTSKRESKGKRK